MKPLGVNSSSCIGTESSNGHESRLGLQTMRFMKSTLSQTSTRLNLVLIRNCNLRDNNYPFLRLVFQAFSTSTTIPSRKARLNGHIYS
jgi:hypothetical protein